MKIGITGHQRLEDPNSWVWVEEAMTDQIRVLVPPLTAVTSLAIGADQLFAKLIERLGGNIYAVIPFVGYERTFELKQVDEYRRFIETAGTAVEVLKTPGSDEDAFLAAGKRVVELADLMIAVWDGAASKGKGGTADIVAFAEDWDVPLIHINPVDRSVSRLNT